jgi:tRNA(Ile)-lysidine synthase
MRGLLKNVQKTIENFSMLDRGDHVLVAVSGGPDSVVLLKVLSLLAVEYRLRLTVAHLNHGLRGGDADNDETFVRQLSEEMGIECITRKVDIRALQKGRGRSLEEIGREERYRFLDEAAYTCGAGKIATGHHMDDQAETVILNLIRGSGTEGLKGIPPVRDQRIIRPLLYSAKKDIQTFLHREGMPYIQDSSNLEPLFLRNRIRNELLPQLTASYNPRINHGLCQTAEILRREDGYLQSVIRQILLKWDVLHGRPEMFIPLAEFMDLHEALRARIIKTLLESLMPFETGISYRHIASVMNLCHSSQQRTVSLDLPCRICVEKTVSTLWIKKLIDRPARQGDRKEQASSPGFTCTVVVPCVVSIPQIGKSIRFTFVSNTDDERVRQSPQIAYLDYEKTSPPLILRNQMPGDRIQSLGMKGTKKLHDYFIDRKVPFSFRKDIPLLMDAKSVIWIAGQTISERVKVSEQTKKVLKAEMV